MHPTAGQIQRVARREDGVDDRGIADACGDGVAVLGPRLRVQRVLVHGFVHRPALLAGGLQDEHVVDVVMGLESLGVRRGDVGVGLHGMTQVVGEASNEIDQRGPQPVQPLKDDRRTGGEFGQHLGRVDLIGHLGAEAGRSGVAAAGQHVTGLGHPDEGRAYPALSDQLINRSW